MLPVANETQATIEERDAFPFSLFLHDEGNGIRFALRNLHHVHGIRNAFDDRRRTCP